MRTRKAFTLIEMLTVIAITAVLLTLIIIPLIRSFELVRAAQGFADAQDKARTLVERISREIANAAAVRDNAGSKGTLRVPVPGENGTVVLVGLPYSKVDLVRPAEGDPSLRGPSGALINPNTGREDPTYKAPKGQVVLPVTQGTTIVRYFVGLRDPFTAYNNPYDGLLMARAGGRDNLFVLYRIEAQPYVWRNGRYNVNNEFFYDLDRDADPNTTGPQFDDPDFFNPAIALPGYNQGPAAGMPADPAKDQMIRNWLSRATIVTEISRYDMVQPVFNKSSRKVTYDNNVPRLVTLIQFRPTGIGNEPTTGQAAVRLSEETDNSAQVAPDVYRTKFGSWSSVFMRMWPGGFNPTAPTAYQIGRVDATSNRFGVFYFDPNVHINEQTDGLALFDSEGYQNAVRRGDLYPFTQSQVNANLTGAARDGFVPFVADAAAGKITSSFGIEEVGLAVRPNDTTPLANTGVANSPVNDPNLGQIWTAPLFTPSNAAYEINASFNKVWAEQNVAGSPINFGLRPDVHRFVDLRVLTFSDGADSPLHPDPARGFARTRIVPGSEVVIGPDQNPGPNFGVAIRYSRVTRDPGPNQYRINYVNQPEPTNPGTGAVDYSQLAPGMPNPPATYDATDFVSAFIQPRFRAGYVQFSSNPNVPLPQGNISISYRFQMNRPDDIFAADYDSRQLMSVLLTMRNYPQSSLPNPQTVTLSATATVRNVLR